MDELILGDCVEVMAGMDEDTVDLTVTSPPYDELRDYKGFTFNFDDTAEQLYRITKQGGVVVWVVGDSVVDGSESSTSFKQALRFKEIGFKLHDTMIYRKRGSSLPDPTRYFQSFEYMFVFSKGKPKTINKIHDVKNTWVGEHSGDTVREKDGKTWSRRARVTPAYTWRSNIWTYDIGWMKTTADDYAYEHPAMFPEALAKDHIISWSNKGDLVLDPFCGSGTTCKMAKYELRKYIGIEASDVYMKIAKRRLAQGVMQDFL